METDVPLLGDPPNERRRCCNSQANKASLTAAARGSKFDRLFFTRLRKIGAIVFGGWRTRETGLALLLMIVAIGEQVAAYYSGLVPSLFYRVLQERSKDKFAQAVPMAIAILVCVALLNAGVKTVSDWFAVRMRFRLAAHLQDKYLTAEDLYYHVRVREQIDNPDQRIAQDIEDLSSNFSLVVARVILTPFVVLFYTYLTFTTMGWQGPVSIYAFFGIATLINHRILTPIVAYIFKQEQLEGEYRFSHATIRTNAEAIAFYKGHAVELKGVSARLASVTANKTHIVMKEFPLYVSTRFFAYTGAMLSYVIVAIPIFRGEYRNASGAEIAGIISATSFYALYLINAFSEFVAMSKDFTTIAGLTGRVGSMLEALKNASANAPTALVRSVSAEEDWLEVHHLTVRRPDGVELINGLSFNLRIGEGVVVTGPNGCGKTSMLRALAGLWEFDGTVTQHTTRPQTDHTWMMFLSQRPFTSPGTLREQVAYPDVVTDAATTAAVEGALEAAGLADLVPRFGLDAVFEWPSILSVGEQQKLCFARLFFHRPPFAVLDESTCSVDEASEMALYAECARRLITPLTVCHRSNLLPLHATKLTFTGRGEWRIEAIERTTTVHS